MTTTILLMRHGETAWNRAQVFRGLYDIPLNENGRAQARHLARALTARKVDVAYSSPLSRARETAQIVLEPQRIEALIHEDFADFNYGEWTGLGRDVVADKWPQEHARWLREPENTRPPGGDTLGEVYARTFGALEEVVQKHDGDIIAFFAHRVVNKLLVLGMLTLGLERFPFIRQDNCCLNEFECSERGYVVVKLNDTAHIRSRETDLLEADF